MSSSGDYLGHLLNDDGDYHGELLFSDDEPAALVRAGPGPAQRFVEHDEMAGYSFLGPNPHEDEEFDKFVKNAESNTTIAKNREFKKQNALRKSLDKKRVKTEAAQVAAAEVAAARDAAARDAAAQAARDQAARQNFNQAIRDQAVQAARAAAALSESRRQFMFQQIELEANLVPNFQDIRNFYSYDSQSPENQLIINRFIAKPSMYLYPPFGGDSGKAAAEAAAWQQRQSGRRGGYKSKSKKSKSKKYRYNKKSKTNKRRRTRSKSRSNKRSRK